MESTDLIPLTGDIAKITRRAEEFRDLHESLQKNLQTYLTLTLDALAGVHQRMKSSAVADATKQMVRSHHLPFFLLSITPPSFRRWQKYGKKAGR